MTKPHFRDVRAALETQSCHTWQGKAVARCPKARKAMSRCPTCSHWKAPSSRPQGPLLPPPDFNLPQLVTCDPKVSASLKQVPNCSLTQQWRAIDRLVGTEALELVLADCADLCNAMIPRNRRYTSNSWMLFASLEPGLPHRSQQGGPSSLDQ